MRVQRPSHPPCCSSSHGRCVCRDPPTAPLHVRTNRGWRTWGLGEPAGGFGSQVSPPLRGGSPQSAVESTFWATLATNKLNTYRLSEQLTPLCGTSTPPPEPCGCLPPRCSPLSQRCLLMDSCGWSVD